MRRTSLKLLFGALAFSWMTVLVAVANPDSDEGRKIQNADVRLDISLEKKSHDFCVNLALTNVSGHVLRFAESDLPWGDRPTGGVSYVLFDPVGDRVIEKSYPISDPGPRDMELAVGQTLKAQVKLSYLYYDYLQTKDWRDRKNPLVLFWTYEFKPLDKPASKRLGGWLSIPIDK